MGDRIYQVAIEFGFKVSENPKSYERFLEKFDGGLAKYTKLVKGYDKDTHTFYSVKSRADAEEVKKKALDTGLVKKVSIEEF
ncbi:hypothetical protein KAT80_02405 [Candidatus Pacearchaeota archaeon]|nr:hypothetical protein [Candidatus Pacearchaeota archaeon]